MTYIRENSFFINKMITFYIHFKWLCYFVIILTEHIDIVNEFSQIEFKKFKLK